MLFGSAILNSVSVTGTEVAALVVVVVVAEVVVASVVVSGPFASASLLSRARTIDRGHHPDEQQQASDDEDAQPAARELRVPARNEHRDDQREAGEAQDGEPEPDLVPRREPQQQHRGNLAWLPAPLGGLGQVCAGAGFRPTTK